MNAAARLCSSLRRSRAAARGAAYICLGHEIAAQGSPGPGHAPLRRRQRQKKQQQPRSALGRNGERYDAARKKSQKKSGGAGYRSRYLPHAKRALYHLSYAPIQTRWQRADLARHKGDEGTAAGSRKPGGGGPGGGSAGPGSRAEHKRWTAWSGGGRSEAGTVGGRGWVARRGAAVRRPLGGGACSAGRLPWVGRRARADE